MNLPVAPPVVSVARGLLVPHFPGVTISSRVPNPRPQRFIRISRAGGPRDWAIDRALILVECWAATEPAASADADLAYAVLAAVNYTEVAPATYWDGGNLVSFDDPAITNQSRYQFTGTLGVPIH